jgi:hypothetical protein
MGVNAVGAPTYPSPGFRGLLATVEVGCGATPVERRSWRYRQQGADSGPRRPQTRPAAVDPTATLAARVRGVRYLI